jgi:hypothetical protein
MAQYRSGYQQIIAVENLSAGVSAQSRYVRDLSVVRIKPVNERKG